MTNHPRGMTRRQLLSTSGLAALGAAAALRCTREPTPIHVGDWSFAPRVHQKVGAFVGGASEEQARAMERWLGRPLDFVQDYGAGTVVNNVFRFDEWPSFRKIALSQPLSADSGWNLGEAAAGRYDGIYARCADNLRRVRDRLICVRIGWEMNGDWMPWSLGGPGTAQTPENYVGAFRRLARMIRTAVPDVPIDWCPNFDKPSEAWYPGDEYVDIIGLDVYLNKRWIANDWNEVLSLPSGLRWLERFAQAHKKLISFPEWATNYDDGKFVENMHAWMRKRPVVYQAYWNDDNAFPGRFERYPSVQRAYLKAWGNKPA